MRLSIGCRLYKKNNGYRLWALEKKKNGYKFCFFAMDWVVSGYGVVAVAAPGVAAEEASDGEVEASEGSVLAEGLDGVLAAGGGVAAAGGCEG